MKFSTITIKKLFIYTLAAYFFIGMNYFAPNMGGRGLYLPFNVIGWIFIITLIMLGCFTILKNGFIKLNKTQMMYFIGFICLAAPLIYTKNEISYQTSAPIFFVLGGLGFYAALFQIQCTKIEKYLILKIILGAILIQAIIGIIQFYGFAPNAHFILNDSFQPQGIFQQKNVLVSFVVTGIGISLFLTGQNLNQSNFSPTKLLFFIIPFIGTMIITIVQAKIGYLGLIITIIFMLPIINFKNKSHQLWFFLMFLGIIIGSWTLNTKHRDFIKTKRPESIQVRDLDNQILSIQNRLQVYTTTFDIWKNNPITGIGYGKWPKVFKQYYAKRFNNNQFDSIADKEYFDHPHNETLLWVTEGGFIAFLGLLIFAGAYLNLIFSHSFKSSLPYLALAMPILIHTQVELPFYISLAHWIIFLIIIQLPEKNNSELKINKVFITPIFIIAIMAYDYMAETLNNNFILTRFEQTGANDYELLLNVEKPNAHHLKYDVYILKSLLDIGLQTKNKKTLQLYLEKAEKVISYYPLLIIYDGIEAALKALNRPTHNIQNRIKELFPWTYADREKNKMSRS